jgi:hypothetical protein
MYARFVHAVKRDMTRRRRVRPYASTGAVGLFRRTNALATVPLMASERADDDRAIQARDGPRLGRLVMVPRPVAQHPEPEPPSRQPARARRGPSGEPAAAC